MQYLLKVSRLGTKAVINGLGLGDDKVASLDVPVKDYISEASLPYSMPSDSPEIEISHSIQRIFISPGRLADFAALLKISLLQKLIPSVQKEGYEETNQTTSGETSNNQGNDRQREDIAEREGAPSGRYQDPLPPAAIPRPFGDPLADIPRPRPDTGGDFLPPGFEDEHGILRPPGRGGYGGYGDGRRPPNIGDRDLYPPGLGPNDPLRIGGPRGGFGSGGGMYPAFDDPIFGGPRHDQGYNPLAPSGARYDPIGPGDGVPRNPGPPGRFPGRGGPPNPFGGFGSGDFI
jgi:hypothetical protein